LQEALALDPDHTDARRLNQRVRDELERRRVDQQRQQAIRTARDHMAAKRFAEALAILDEIERRCREPAACRNSARRSSMNRRKRTAACGPKNSTWRLRTREAMQGPDLERAGQMVDHLYATFADEPGAADVLPGLRARLAALIRAKETAQYQQKVRGLLKEKSFRAALDLLAEALRKFPDDAGLERLRKSAEDLLPGPSTRRRHCRGAETRPPPNATAAMSTARSTPFWRAARALGDEAAFADLAHQLEMEIEQQRYSAALEGSVEECQRDDGRRQVFRSHRWPGWRQGIRRRSRSARPAGLGSGGGRHRRGAALCRGNPGSRGKLQSEGAWTQALGALDKGLSRYPHNSSLVQTADRLRDRVELERARASIEKYRGIIRQEIDGSRWRRAAEALHKARAEFPGDRAFDDLADRVAAGQYEEGWRAVEARVNRDLTANAFSQAQGNLESEATRTVYAKDPRWKALAQEVAKRREYEEALVEAERRRKAGSLSEAEELLTAIIDQGPRDKRAQQLRGAIEIQRSEALRQQEIARITQEIREHLKQDDLVQAASALAAARSRYPGENAWTELQAGLDARQQLLRRKADIAATVDRVRLSLSRDDIREAVAVLISARAKFPGEAVWTALETEINARQAILKRQSEIVAMAESVRRRLNRDHTRAGLDAGSVTDICQALLSRRREDLPPAIAEVVAARAKYPGEHLWDTLQAEIDERRAFLDAESALAERVRQCLERGELAQAEARLAAARAQYPDDDLWGIFLAEIERHKELLKSRAEVARIARGIRDRLERDDLAGVIADFDAARARYPNESVWMVLQTEIDARQAALQRQAEIADVAVSVRASMDDGIPRPEAIWGLTRVQLLEVLRKAAARLDEARTRYPGEGTWNTLQAEIDARQAQLQSEITESVRNCPSLDQLGSYARVAAAARTRYPGDSFWETLQAAIDTRRKPLEEASKAQFLARVRESLKQGDLAAAQARLREARDKHPHASLWADLQAEIDARQALIARQAEVAAAGERVRACIERDDLRQAAAELDTARAKYPGEALWATLQAAIDARLAEIEAARGRAETLLEQGRPEEALALIESRFAQQPRFADLLTRARQALDRQRRREARDRDRDRLLAIQQQIETEPRKRKRKELDREAQRVAAGYTEDQEIVALAAGVHSRIEAVPSAPAAQKLVPWKMIGGGVAAVAAAAVLVVLLHNRPPTPSPAPKPTATIPIEIRTDPPGASLRVGERSCVTPNCQLDVAPGSYRVEAQLQGYEPKQQTVIFDSSNRTVDLTLRPLAPPPPPAQGTGTLIVQAALPDVLVYVDGSLSTRTDQTGSVTLSLEGQTHEVRVERNGYDKPAAKQVKITAGARQTVAFRLIPQNARLEVGGAPAGLEVRMDGKPLGRADGSPDYLFPAPVQSGDRILSVGQGLLQAGQGTAGRTLTQRFEPGQTVRLSWKPEPPPPTAPTIAKKVTPTPEEIEERDWEKVRDASDPAQLRDFRKNYPNGRHAKEAESQLDRLAWSNTKKDSVESLRAYLRDFSSGTYAPEANSHIADLVWKGVDPGKIEQVRKFLEENPNNPHTREAQLIIDKANARQDATQDVLRRYILDTLNNFNLALAKKQESQLKAIWPKPIQEFLKSLRLPGQKISLQLPPEDIKIQGDNATVRCQVSDTLPKPRNRAATIELHYIAGRWIIEEFKVGQ
jgi:hypothetical protein